MDSTDRGHPKHLCPICGDTANGMHYGVYSCEGCKGFFKRTLRKGISYACRDKRNCIINKRQRNRCQHCRYQKCLQMGMKKEAVQEARRRTKDRDTPIEYQWENKIRMLLEAEKRVQCNDPSVSHKIEDLVASTSTKEEYVKDDKDQKRHAVVKTEEDSEISPTEYPSLGVDILNIQDVIKEETIDVTENDLDETNCTETFAKNQINHEKEHIEKCIDDTICYLIKKYLENRHKPQFTDYLSKMSFLEQLKKEL
ncbi:unnamed protein product [Brassicogethes aeneus]|uniref:Nuclear receptor domain-containing protein n=1 Tax=Brassicogethes aeneus TaxID=1431903 RepID=A0A9P0AZR0_BRAAE|nr:unnamed protein product [Brassicogethes aeneus]